MAQHILFAGSRADYGTPGCARTYCDTYNIIIGLLNDPRRKKSVTTATLFDPYIAKASAKLLQRPHCHCEAE
jgi:hypothetical protein